MGKNSYKLGYWTPSTLATLEIIKKKNLENVKPRAKDFETGTLKNWAYILKSGGYLSNGDGFALTQLGEQLLSDLRKNPPQDRRGKVRQRLKQSKKQPEGTATTTQPQIQTTNCQLSIRGNDIAFDVILTQEQTMEAINAITNIKKK